MANPISLSLNEYPQLARLINGQDITLEIKVRVGSKTLTGQGEYITMQPGEIDIDDTDERKPSIQEILLASIDNSMNRTAQPTP